MLIQSNHNSLLVNKKRKMLLQAQIFFFCKMPFLVSSKVLLNRALIYPKVAMDHKM